MGDPVGGLTVGDPVGFTVGDNVGDLVSVVGAKDSVGLVDGATSKNSIGSFIRSTAHL